MNLIERVKKILTTPKTEWLVIETELSTPQTLLMSYVIPLAALSAVGFVLTGLIFPGIFDMKFWIVRGVIGFLSSCVGYYISTYVIDALAPSFGSEKNINRSAQLVAYSNTAAWVGGFFVFIPIIGWLISIAGAIYTIYLMYVGIGPMKKTPEDKKVVYLILSIVLVIVVAMVVGAILNSIILKAMGYSAFGMWG